MCAYNVSVENTSEKQTRKQTRMPTKMVLLHQGNPPIHMSVVQMAVKLGLRGMMNQFKVAAT